MAKKPKTSAKGAAAPGKVPSARPAVLVLLSVALSLPTLSNIVNRSISSIDAGEHLVGAIVVSWVGVTLVGRLIDSYRAASRHRESEQLPRTHSQVS